MQRDIVTKLKQYIEDIERASKPEKITRNKNSRDIDMILDGYEVKTEDKSCFILEKKIPASYIYGGKRLSDVEMIDKESIEIIFGKAEESIKSVNKKDHMFFDLETTGLQGGVGTLAFLIGTGYFEEDHFVIKQYFIRDYDEEISALLLLKEQMSGYKNLISFNGKAFDMNLIRTRYIYNHIKPPGEHMFHLDLLHPSRNIWKHKLDSCSLVSLEENVLNEFRVGDIPGYAIPSVYFKYLEDRDASDLKKVIEHNRQDIISMAALLVRIFEMITDPVAESCESELMGIAGFFRKKGNRDKYIRCLNECMNSSNDYISRYAKKELSIIYKRDRDYTRAVTCWEEMVEDSSGMDFYSLIELAKYYEHKLKNINEALTVSIRAYSNYKALGRGISSIENDLIKRINRLKTKAGKNKNA